MQRDLRRLPQIVNTVKLLSGRAFPQTQCIQTQQLEILAADSSQLHSHLKLLGAAGNCLAQGYAFARVVANDWLMEG